MISERELLEFAWGILANVSNGDWQQQSNEWQHAVINWRDKYHSYITGNEYQEPFKVSSIVVHKVTGQLGLVVRSDSRYTDCYIGKNDRGENRYTTSRTCDLQSLTIKDVKQ